MFTKLLVPLDRSPLAEQAVDRAGAIARACHAAVDDFARARHYARTTSPLSTPCVGRRVDRLCLSVPSAG